VKVAITRANSAVGRALLRRGSAQSEAPVVFVAAVRSDCAARELRPLLGTASRVARISYDDPPRLGLALDEVCAVVHLAGALVERPDSTYEQANVETARRVVEAARRCRVKKLVLVSAIGADDASPNRDWRTKGQAEALVRASGLPHPVLRVSLPLGFGTEGARGLRRRASRRVAAPRFSPDALEVATADTSIDPFLAAAELGIALTGLNAMIDRRLEPGHPE